ncbi:hypothetical protein FK220_004715 [Flavobacteriaceae bacterium TP-CH-4]|uniref:G8 domain-containing protein n=1 Tax=Pelagihabitans pacificus TaxID=2696054 RepID=A0A967AQU3_9FLAO|nr:G8 domain-containing protein [Pelagihabitans pacificus]NHF58628.1 hypothetical protein [Pelagihabitans pacificus]
MAVKRYFVYGVCLLLTGSLAVVRAKEPRTPKSNPVSHTEPIETKIIVKKGDRFVLSGKSLQVDTLLVKGTLVFEDHNNFDLSVAVLEIDGGTLRAGTSKKPISHSFLIDLSGGEAHPAQLTVKNGGRLLLFGNTEVYGEGEIHLDTEKEVPSRPIVISSQGNFGFIRLTEAAEAVFDGVQLRGLGVAGTHPVLSWQGTQSDSGVIRNSIFVDSRHTDLFLATAGAVIENNLFISRQGSSIYCASSRNATDNRIHSNRIVNTTGNHIFALAIHNPYQTVTQNHITVSGPTSGIGILLQNEHKNVQWEKPTKTFALNHNTVEAKGAHPVPGTVGIQIDAFDHKAIWRSTNNRIANFGLGLQTYSKNTVLDGYSFEHNTVGLIPGVAYLQNSRFLNDANHGKSTAVWVTDAMGASAPKISGLQITGSDIGFQIEGTPGANNYFEKITYRGVPRLLKFNEMDATSFLYDKDRSLTQTKAPEVVPEPGAAVPGHDHHAGKQPLKGLYLFHQDAFLNTKNSRPYPSNPSIYTASATNFGTLTISTGFGLEDPVHEHRQIFNSIWLRNSDTQKIMTKEKAVDNESFFLAANTLYEFDYGRSDRPLYDLSFEWDAPKGNWIMLKFRYTHPNVQGLRSFGSLIDRAASMHNLMHQNQTSYYFDAATETVFVKIYNDGNRDELVIYSSDILTEIQIDGKKVPLSMYTDLREDKVVISYELPKALPSTLLLADHYGNTLKTLHTGISDSGKISTAFSLQEYDVRKGVFLYFLTVNDQTHKGPVYAY